MNTNTADTFMQVVLPGETSAISKILNSHQAKRRSCAKSIFDGIYGHKAVIREEINMLNEITILEQIHKNDNVSQRQISASSGMSLGMVNMLLKKLVRAGYVKSEKLTGSKVKYIITPKGFAQLSYRTLRYVRNSYIAIKRMQTHMEEVITSNFNSNETVIIYGEQDEIYELLLEVLNNTGHNHEITNEIPTTKKYIQWQEPNSSGIYLMEGMV